jgi:hypothetical protein
MNRVDIPLFATLRFECAATGKLVDYEVPGDAGTLKDLWPQTLLRSCGHCGQMHRFAFRSAYVAGLLASRRPQSLVGDGSVDRSRSYQA